MINNAPGTPVAKFTDVLKAAKAAELDHYKALQSLGAKPLTLKFWAPDHQQHADVNQVLCDKENSEIR